MAKRLTDSNKWQDAWFMDLPSKYKLFWLYLLDNCDHAGIWKVNFKVAAFHIGEHLEPSEVKRILFDRINFISDFYWQIKKFIDFQYGGIKNDAVGKSVQKILNSHNIQYNITEVKGLDSPYEGTKDKVKDNVIVIDNVMINNVLPVLEFFEVQLNGLQREYNNLAWRPLVDKWFNEHIGERFKDNDHVKNSFKKFYINQKPLKQIKFVDQNERMKNL